jgi:hypothetical protein
LTLAFKGRHINIKYELIIICTVTLIGLSSAVYLFQLDNLFLIYYNDSISHLVRSREYVDSLRPGLFEQMGTGWLPLTHLLLLPFSLMDSLFTSGFAGLALSLPCLAISSVFLYRIIRMQIGITYISIAGALLYALNPNLLYLGITAMTEAPFMLFFIISAYYFQKYISVRSFKFQSDSRILRSTRYKFYTYGLNELIKCSVFISLATLCRYEGWILPMFLVPYVFITVIKRTDYVTSTINSRKIEKIFSGPKAYNVYSILISLVSFSGVVFWMSYNAYSFNDPLEFQHAKFWSASWITKELGSANTLYLNPFNVASEYIGTALMIYGPILLIAAIIGYLLVTFFNKQRLKQVFPRAPLYLFLLLPAIVIPISMLMGSAELNTRHEWFNSRYVVLLSPIVALLCSVFISYIFCRFKIKNIMGGALLAGLFLSQFLISYSTVVTYADGQDNKLNGSRPFVMKTAEVLKSKYTGGKVLLLTGSPQQNNIMQAAGISLNSFDYILNGNAWKESFKAPWLHANYIIISKEPDPSAADVSKYWLDRQFILDKYYDVTYENKFYKVMIRK